MYFPPPTWSTILYIAIVVLEHTLIICLQLIRKATLNCNECATQQPSNTYRRKALYNKCRKSFLNRSSLLKHKRVHTGERCCKCIEMYKIDSRNHLSVLCSVILFVKEDFGPVFQCAYKFASALGFVINNRLHHNH